MPEPDKLVQIAAWAGIVGSFILFALFIWVDPGIDDFGSYLERFARAQQEARADNRGGKVAPDWRRR